LCQIWCKDAPGVTNSNLVYWSTMASITQLYNNRCPALKEGYVTMIIYVLIRVAKNRHPGTIAQFCRAISSQLRHVSTIGKNELSSNISSTCPHNVVNHNMVNFGPLAAEIVSLAWGTPANFNGYGLLAALLDGTLVVGVSQTLCR